MPAHDGPIFAENDPSFVDIGLSGALRGRLGVVFDRLMIYGTAGVAFANVSEGIVGLTAGEQLRFDDELLTGWVAGAGAEYAFTEKWSGRAEYLYTDYEDLTGTNSDGNTASFDTDTHAVRLGLSYRF